MNERNLKNLPTFNFFMPPGSLGGKQTSPKIAAKKIIFYSDYSGTVQYKDKIYANVDREFELCYFKKSFQAN